MLFFMKINILLIIKIVGVKGLNKILSLPSSSTSTLKNKKFNDFEIRRSIRGRVKNDFGLDFYVYDPFFMKESLFSLDSIFRKVVVNDEME